MPIDHIIERMEILNNKYAEDTITLEELYELNRLAKDIFYLTADSIFHRDPAKKDAYENQFDNEGNSY